MGKQLKQCQTSFFGGSKITAHGDYRHDIKRCLLFGRKVMTNLDSILKSRDVTLPTKVHLVTAMVVPVVMMWELDCEESWVPKNWCFWSVLLEKTLVRPLDCKEIQPVHPKGDQSWVFIGRNDAKAETPILWPPHAKSWLIGKDPDTGMDWLDLLAVQGTLKSLLQHHSSKASILWHSAFFVVQLSHPHMTTGKITDLTRRTFICNVTSLLFNMLSRLVITFLPRSKRLLISWLQSPSAVILEPR